MKHAHSGLENLRKIELALNDSFLNEETPDDVTKEIVYNLHDFWSLNLDKIYDELFLNDSYVVLTEYKRLLEMTLNKLPDELLQRGAEDLTAYFGDEYERCYEGSIKEVRELNNLIDSYEKEKKHIETSTTIQGQEKIMEIYQLDNGFSLNYNDKIASLINYGDKFNDINLRMNVYDVSDILPKILIKARELYDLVISKLKDVPQPADVFIDEPMIWMAHGIFKRLELIEEVGFDEFRNQLGFRDKQIKIKAKPKKKTLIAKTIYQLCDFVIPEYRETWETKMADYFKIKSYPKIKNKQYDSEEEFLLERLIRPFKELL